MILFTGVTGFLGSQLLIDSLDKKIKLLSNSPTILGFGDIPFRADEIMASEANISKLQRLGWSPKISVSEGLELFLNEYDGNFHD